MPKYAKIEFERKFLLAGLPTEISPDFRIIYDLYIPHTTLRLRHVTDQSGRQDVFKLTQKKREHGAMWITSIYLSADEFRLFTNTPAGKWGSSEVLSGAKAQSGAGWPVVAARCSA
jgi:hypothetical protein